MDSINTTHELLATLTPRELTVLRQRFGIDKAVDDEANGTVMPPPDSDDNSGSGGVPAPAEPLDR